MDFYNLIKYKTNDEFEISLVKEGMSNYLAKLLNSSNTKKYINLNDGIHIDKNILDCLEINEVLMNELKDFIID
jgi:hypothetical protein